MTPEDKKKLRELVTGIRPEGTPWWNFPEVFGRNPDDPGILKSHIKDAFKNILALLDENEQFEEIGLRTLKDWHAKDRECDALQALLDKKEYEWSNAYNRGNMLQARLNKLEAALKQIQIHNAEAINGYARGFMREAENDVRDAQKIAREVLQQDEKDIKDQT